MRVRFWRRAAAIVALLVGVGMAVPVSASADTTDSTAGTVQTAGDWWW